MNKQEIEDRIQRLEKITSFLDDGFTIPIINIKIGFDGIAGLLPIGGDTISLILSLYWLSIARKIPGTKSVMPKLVFTLILDYLIGLIPVLGDISDIFFKANRKNFKTLQRAIRQEIV